MPAPDAELIARVTASLHAAGLRPPDDDVMAIAGFYRAVRPVVDLLWAADIGRDDRPANGAPVS